MARVIGWLIAIALLTLFTALFAYELHYSERRRSEEHGRLEHQRAAKAFAKVKSGATDVAINSPELIVMLANDKDCINNLRSIYFFMAVMSDPRYAQTANLTNVADISFYDCNDLDRFLVTINGMPSLTTLYFESVKLDDDILKSLRSFPNLKKVQFDQILDQHQIEVLAKEVPNVIAEGVDPISGEPMIIQGATP
jgi:hypothetical protein